MKDKVLYYNTCINKIIINLVNSKFINFYTFFNCMLELYLILKKTFEEINNLYYKHLLLPKMQFTMLNRIVV